MTSYFKMKAQEQCPVSSDPLATQVLRAVISGGFPTKDSVCRAHKSPFPRWFQLDFKQRALQTTGLTEVKNHAVL